MANIPQIYLDKIRLMGKRPEEGMSKVITAPGRYADIIGIPERTDYPEALPEESQQSGQPSGRQPFSIPREILQMLPSLIAAGVGLGVPGALPGAAGFSEGYAEGLEKEKERKIEREKLKPKMRNFSLMDEEGKVIKTMQIGEDDYVRVISNKNKEETDDIVERVIKESMAEPKTTKEIEQKAMGRYKKGDIIEKFGMKYRVIGGDPNDPDVIPAQ